MLEAVELVARGRARPAPQDESRASFQGLVTDEVARLDWSKSAVELDRWIRGCDPNPGAHARWRGETVRLFGARLASREDERRRTRHGARGDEGRASHRGARRRARGGEAARRGPARRSRQVRPASRPESGSHVKRLASGQLTLVARLRRTGRCRRVLEEDAAHLLDGGRAPPACPSAGCARSARTRRRSMCALSYLTTPSLASSSGSSSSTEMMECAVTPGTTGTSASALMKRLPGDMLSMLVPMRPPASAPARAERREIGARPAPRPTAAAPGAARGGARAGARPGSCRGGASRGRSRAARRAAAPRTGRCRSSSFVVVRELRLLERLVADPAPEAVARVDRRHLGQQAALAVAEHDHVAQAGVGASRVGARHRLREGLPELPAPSRRSDCPSRSGRTRTRSGGAAADRRSGRSPCPPSAPGLDSVPCTNTAGMRPR